MAASSDVTAQDVAFYQEQGYFIHHQQVFSPERFAGLKDLFEEMLADIDPTARPEAMDVPHFAYPQLFDWLLSDEVIDLVEAFLGPDIALWSSHFISKPPGDGLIVPWHEDSAYWGPRLNPMKVMTVWLGIDDSTVENGCMRVIPKTHGAGYSEYEPVDGKTHVFGTQIRADQFDEDTAVDLEIAAGECHMHDARLMHASNANLSARRRCGYTMRYIPSSVKVQKDDRWNHAIYLARGRDLAGNEYGDPSVAYEEGVRTIYARR
jgi:chlorinating enzyme